MGGAGMGMGRGGGAQGGRKWGCGGGGHNRISAQEEKGAAASRRQRCTQSLASTRPAPAVRWGSQAWEYTAQLLTVWRRLAEPD